MTQRSAGESKVSSTRGAPRTLRNRIRYRFDRLLSRGTWAVLLWLGAITLLVVAVSSLLLTAANVTFSGSGDSSLAEQFWQSLLRVIDPGTMAGDVGWARRILALIVTITGLLIAGTLIGLIASGVEQRVEGLRRGRSIVVEMGHYVVLGWSGRLHVVIDQLTKADPASVVVVVADRDASEMDDELRSDLDSALGQRLIFRTGDPRQGSSLDLANVAEARSIVVLAGGESGDADVVTTVLNVGREIGFDRAPIVAEVSRQQTREKLLQVTGPLLHPVIVAESASRLASLVLRQPGLSEVAEDLIDAATPGVHVKEVPALVGSTFAEAVFSLDGACPIGLVSADGALQLNPPREAKIEPTHQIVAITGRPDALVPGRRRPVPPPGEPLQLSIEPARMRLLFIGWNDLASTMLTEFDRFADDGSTALILYDEDLLAPEDIPIPATAHFAVESVPGTDPRQPLREMEFTSIVLLAYGGIGADEADSRTLLDLAIVSDQLEADAATGSQVLVQILDARRAALAELSGRNSFVVSDAIGSQLLAQLATTPECQAVFAGLYDPDRSSLHLTSPDVLGIEDRATFDDVITAAYAAGVLAVGWLTSAGRGRRVVFSPPLSDTIESSDQIIVVG